MHPRDESLKRGTDVRPGRAAATASGQWISLAVALLLLFVAIAPGPATNVMLDQIAGPYEITVGASPMPLKVGQGHVSVLVQKHSNALVVMEAQVTVTATSLEGDGASITRQATHEQAADERQYGTPLAFESPGRWEITVQVDGPEGPATARFQVTVQRDFPVQPIVYLGLVGIPLSGVLLIAYWLRSGEERADDNTEEKQEL